MKNIWEKVKDFTSPYAADDDYDDEYDDEMEDGFSEEEPASRYNARANRRERRGMTGDDAGAAEGETAEKAAAAPAFSAPLSTGFNGHVMNSSVGNKQQLVLVRPETFNDAPAIATNLREKKAVVLNLDNVDKALARRVVDFLSGCTYAVDGSVKKVAHATYLFCPSNMEITGDLKNLTGEAEAYV